MATMLEVVEKLILEYRLHNPHKGDPSVLLVPKAMYKTFCRHWLDSVRKEGFAGKTKRCPTIAEVEHALLTATGLVGVLGLRSIVYEGTDFDIGDDDDLPFKPEDDPLNEHFPQLPEEDNNGLPPGFTLH